MLEARGDPRLIPLTKGKEALVSECDYHWLSQRKWHYTGNGYAAAYLFGGKNSPVKVTMHRLIMLSPDKITVDHINHNTLDNRRSNLRLATQSEQNQNRKIEKGRSRFKGVYLRRDQLKWCAQVKPVGGKTLYLGSFLTEEEAADAYNVAAIQHFGQFAYLNDTSFCRIGALVNKKP